MVIDTMIFAYATLAHSSFAADSRRALERAYGRVWVPESVRAELVNVAWLTARAGLASWDDARMALDDAEALFSHVIPTRALWTDAFRLAREHDHSPYDTLFVALARSEMLLVVTTDGPLLKKFPEDTVSLADFVAS
jgi:predicted nucleic acid-binding protein